MLIRATDLPDPPAGDPFLHDKLDRKQYAEPLTQLVENTPDPFVLAVDGGWGTGKTSFLRMWCRHLEDRGHRCLYFSAWKNDFAVDPLAALVAELSADLEKDSSPLSDRSQKILAELKKVANVLSRRFASAAIASSLYSLWSSRSPNEPDEHQQALENFSNSAGEVVSDAVGSYLAGRRDLEKFRSLLSDLVAELADQDPKGSPRKVVLFVDELDRCRPLYALELLERVKHLFDVSGVAFVLGLDLDQLAHGVRAVNGGSFDAPGYLRRFIDHRQRLADPPLDRLGDLPIWSTIEALCSDRKFLEDVKTPKKYLLVSSRSLSGREDVAANADSDDLAAQPPPASSPRQPFLLRSSDGDPCVRSRVASGALPGCLRARVGNRRALRRAQRTAGLQA
jgi:KAP family P-loop domain